MRHRSVVALLGALVVVPCTPVHAATDDITLPPQLARVVEANEQVRYVHAEIVMPHHVLHVDYARPGTITLTDLAPFEVADRALLTTVASEEANRIGPVPRRTGSSLVTPWRGYSWHDAGTASLDGRAMHRYAYGEAGQMTTTLWVGDDDRIARVGVRLPTYVRSTRFSHYIVGHNDMRA